MKIYIAYDYRRDPVAIVLSDSQDKAEIAFTAMKTNFTSTEVVDPDNTDLAPNGVVYLFGSKKIIVGPVNDKHEIRILKRGL